MFALLDPRVWLVVLALMAGAYAGGRWHQYKSHAKEAAVAELRATQEARAKEAAWASATSRIRDAKDLEIASVSAQRDDALKRLRDRPAGRLPATASCSGNGAATGAQLSRPDAEFLTGLAARADRLAAGLKACQGWVEAVKK